MILKYFFVGQGANGANSFSIYVNAIADELVQWCVIVLGFALVLGVLNVARINLKGIIERKRDWGYKLILIICMVCMFSFGLHKWKLDEETKAAKLVTTSLISQNAPQAEVDSARIYADKLEKKSTTTPFDFMYFSIYMSLSATIFSLLAFYVASAAYRSFRARNFLSALLLISAIVVMIGRVPVGAQISSAFPWLQEWIMTWPNTAGQRAIQIGAAIGVIASGLRIIFGVERPYLKG
ncbi:hypothetical protein GX645_06705 [Candidatus Sumerlaeota bacterium]|nr:hypothetical protein [Candidatus Sumerlaeota bacterium]